jgi:hypothetical protein
VQHLHPRGDGTGRGVVCLLVELIAPGVLEAAPRDGLDQKGKALPPGRGQQEIADRQRAAGSVGHENQRLAVEVFPGSGRRGQGIAGEQATPSQGDDRGE